MTDPFCPWNPNLCFPRPHPNRTPHGSYVEEVTGAPFYVDQIKHLRDNEMTTVYVDFSHVLETRRQLAQSIQAEFFRFEPSLRRAVFALVAKYDPDYTRMDSNGSESNKRDFWVSWYGLPTHQKYVFLPCPLSSLAGLWPVCDKGQCSPSACDVNVANAPVVACSSTAADSVGHTRARPLATRPRSD